MTGILWILCWAEGITIVNLWIKYRKLQGKSWWYPDARP